MIVEDLKKCYERYADGERGKLSEFCNKLGISRVTYWRAMKTGKMSDKMHWLLHVYMEKENARAN